MSAESLGLGHLALNLEPRGSTVLFPGFVGPGQAHGGPTVLVLTMAARGGVCVEGDKGMV